MGTSKNSSNMYFVYQSLIYQFCNLYNIEQTIKDIKTASDAKEYFFNQVIKQVKLKENRVVLILLDAIDQLNENDYRLTWLDYNLPKGVKIILSSLDNHAGIIEKLKKKLKDEQNYLEIKAMSFENGLKQLKQRFNNQERDLKPHQWHIIENCLKNTKEIYPLHIKLLFDVTYKWRSSYIPSLDALSDCMSTIDTIKHMFKEYELHYGPILFKHCVFYLTILKNGISDDEIEDILSLDDEVLNEIFEKHEPPIRRLPSAIWFRLRDSMNEYLTEKQSDDTLVISWFHVSFIKAAHEYYNELFQFCDTRDKLLQNIIDYFNEEWMIKQKNYLFNNEFKCASRATQSQKLKFKAKKTNNIVYNKRKLNELLNVILLLNDNNLKVKYMIDYVYLNYQFMHCKAELNDLYFIIDTHPYILNLYENLVKETHNDELNKNIRSLVEISCLYYANYGSLTNYPDSLIYEIISRCSVKESVNKLINTICNEELTLIPLQNGFLPSVNVDEQILYVRDNKSRYQFIYWCFNSPYFLVHKDFIDSLKLVIIDYKSGKILNDELEIWFENLNETPKRVILPFFNEIPQNDIRNLDEIDGGIVYISHYNSELNEYVVSVKTFMNETFDVKTCKTQIQNMHLISLNSLLVIYRNSFEIINFNNQEKFCEFYKSVLFNDDILKIELTVPTSQEIFTAEYDSIDYVILCVIFKNKVQIYNYDKRNNQIINEDFLTQIILSHDIYYRLNESNFYHDVSCVLDKQYSIQSLLTSNRVNDIKSSKQLISLVLYNGTYVGDYDKSFKIDNSLFITHISVQNSIDKKEFKFTVTNLIENFENFKEIFQDIKSTDTLKIFDLDLNNLVVSISEYHEKKEINGLYHPKYRYKCIYIYDISM